MNASPAPSAADPYDLEFRPIGFADPLRWLALGTRDFARAPAIGLFYGACFVFMGWALVEVFERAAAYTLALSAGFLLLGPFLCLGLYEVSQRLERGEKPDFAESLTAWDACLGQMALFCLVLLVLELLWAQVALFIFALSFDSAPDFAGSLFLLLTPRHLPFFITYAAIATMFAIVVFAISVISIPMILDRRTDAVTAGLTSLRLVLTYPGVMGWWSLVITGLVVAALLPQFIGLLVVGPVIGHASWHAYRAVLGDNATAAAETPRRQIGA